MSNLHSHSFARNRRLSRHAMPIVTPAPGGRIAGAYDHVGSAYGQYADGGSSGSPDSAIGRYAHADGIVWRTIRKTMETLYSKGIRRLRVLDAGCGPGAWIGRIAAHAASMGLELEAIGFDISTGQLEIARRKMERLGAADGTGKCPIEFVNHDLADPLPWPDRHFHIVLSNYVVLNHLRKNVLPRAIEELCRVASHRVIATVRALASPPTGCIIGTEQVREYRQDCARGELSLVLKDGSEHLLTFNVFSAETMKTLFGQHASVMDVRAIDIFLNRFSPDMNWTGPLVSRLPGRDRLIEELKALEERLCRDPGWIDHGTHVLIVVRPKPEADCLT